MSELIFIGMVYESFIIVIAFVLLFLVYRKYREKRKRLTLVLFVIFINFVLGIVFSWLSKVVRLYTGLDYLIYPDVPSPGTFLAELLLRIVAFRFTFLFLTIGVAISYILKVEAFNEEYKSWEKYTVIIFGFITGFYLMVFYNKSMILLDLIAFLLIAAYTGLIYLPFMIKSFRMGTLVDKTEYKTAFYSLGVMALGFLGVLVFQFIDRVFILFGSPGYTIFYFFGMSSAIVSILGAYLGYIRPGEKTR